MFQHVEITMGKDLDSYHGINPQAREQNPDAELAK